MDPKPFTRSPDRWIFGCRRFRAAQFAVERDYSNYEEVSGTDSDEGLVIANLGIAPQIVDALAKKGIAKLFPIQVMSICCVH